VSAERRGTSAPAIVLLAIGWVVSVAAAFVPIGWAAPIGVLVFVGAGLSSTALCTAGGIWSIVHALRQHGAGVPTSWAPGVVLTVLAVASWFGERLLAILVLVIAS
jgi:hypothetical protein